MSIFVPQKSLAGVTLIELLLVVSVITLVALASIFGGGVNKNNRTLQVVLTEVSAVLENAKQKSIAQEHGEEWGVRFVNESPAPFYEIVSGVPLDMLSAIAHERYVLSDGVNIITPAFGARTLVIFQKNKGTLLASSTIVFGAKNSQKKGVVSIDALGHIVWNLL